MFLKRLFAVLAIVLVTATVTAQTRLNVTSPDNNLSLNFWMADGGVPMYELSYKNKPVILPSAMGLELKETYSFEQLPDLRSNLMVMDSKQSASDTKWKPVWGDVNEIRDNYHQLQVTLQQRNDKSIAFVINFKVFNDGIGFRYEFPEQKNLTYFIITEEKTEFRLTGDHTAFWIPGDFDSNEFSPNVSKLSEVNTKDPKYAANIYAHQFIDSSVVQTPLMLKSADGLYLNFHEAALVNYPAMNLDFNKTTNTLRSMLVPDALGNKAYLHTPEKTPWRTIIVSDKATDILASHLILNLNEPCAIKDVSWIKPTKYVGIWWEMHIGKSTWDYAGNQNSSSFDPSNLKPTGRHGATTANAKRYIDFASKNGFDGVLIEGWNVGWEDWFGRYKEDVFDFVTPYPDFDVKELQKYAASKHVKLIMHHETSASVTNYERQMDTAYRFMKKFGYDAVKTGYVGHIIPRGEHHDGQWMVNHYVRVAKKTASYKIMLDAHEPVRPTGLSRTYPNWLACEAARGMEFNAWSEGNKPRHETILPFTRFMGGPMDYTPGIFQLDLSYWDKNKKETIHTTLAKQLALYVTICSPLQMAADLPESYEKHMDAFQFIKDVAVDWDDSKYLEAEPGQYITVARKAKGTDKWFLGAITNENGRSTSVNCSFLDPGKKYNVVIYADADDAHYEKNAAAYKITKQVVDNTATLQLKLAPGGGCAISFIPVK